MERGNVLGCRLYFDWEAGWFEFLLQMKIIIKTKSIIGPWTNIVGFIFRWSDQTEWNFICGTKEKRGIK